MEHTTIGQVASWLDATFHPELQEDYDNAGFLVGERQEPCTGILIALDLTPAVADEAITLGLNLIVTHHPFIFSGLRRITSDNEAGRTVISLIRHGIAVYAAHTNLDNLPWGVNGILSEKLGLQNTRILKPFSTPHSPLSTPAGAGMVGELPEPMEVDAFLQKVKQVLRIPTLRTSPLPTTHYSLPTVKKVALCGGSGASFIADALAAKADIYITADLKYHDFQRAEGRIILVDAGHYETEQFAKEIFYRAISEKFRNFACRISSRQQSLVQYI
jgi:dinuclear metal center YbgI/SA1388 family protein